MKENESITATDSQGKSKDMLLSYIRRKAVDDAWKREAELVRNGKGTRNWTVSQQAELLKTGKVAGFEGSHMLSVKDYPEHGRNPDNIQLLPGTAHFEGVHQGNTRKESPNGWFDEKTGKIIEAVDGKIPKQTVINLTNRYDPSQEKVLDQLKGYEQSGTERRVDYIASRKKHLETPNKGHRHEMDKQH